MMQKPNAKSSWLVWVALLATLVLCYLASQSPDAEELELVAEEVHPQHASTSKSITKGSEEALRRLQPNASPLLSSTSTTSLVGTEAPVSLTFRQDSVVPSTKDLFHRYVPIVKKTAIPANLITPPTPVAPKAPFEYIGKLEDELATTYFFMAQQRLVSAHLGDKLDGLWKLEREDAQSLQLEYLPLALRQTLSKQAQIKAKTPSNKELPTQVTQ